MAQPTSLVQQCDVIAEITVLAGSKARHCAGNCGVDSLRPEPLFKLSISSSGIRRPDFRT
jgi:hypothetical protein